MWTQPRRKAIADKSDAGCKNIFGLFMELHFILRALMEIRAPFF
jgi:hypothetical protein